MQDVHAMAFTVQVASRQLQRQPQYSLTPGGCHLNHWHSIAQTKLNGSDDGVGIGSLRLVAAFS